MCGRYLLTITVKYDACNQFRVLMNLNKQKIDKFYISEHDIFLHEFDKNNPEKSNSQQAEINKHAKLHALRDGVELDNKSSIFKKVLRVFHTE